MPPRPKIGKVTSGPKTQQTCGVCHLSGGTSGNSSGTSESLLPLGHLSGGTNGGSHIKPGFSYHLSLLKSQVIEGTSGPGRTSGPPAEDKKRTTMAQTRGSTGVFPVVRVCKNKKSVQEWGILTPRYRGKAAGAPGVSTLVHVWISSRGSAPGCERMCYPWTIC